MKFLDLWRFWILKESNIKSSEPNQVIYTVLIKNIILILTFDQVLSVNLIPQKS